MDPYEDEELSEFIYDAQDGAAFDSVSDISDKVSKRGPKRIPEQWTRVISITYDRLDNL